MEQFEVSILDKYGFPTLIALLAIGAIRWGVKWFVNRALEREQATVNLLLAAEREKSTLIADSFNDGITKIIETLKASEQAHKQREEERAKRQLEFLGEISKLHSGLDRLEAKVDDNSRRLAFIEKGR